MSATRTNLHLQPPRHCLLDSSESTSSHKVASLNCAYKEDILIAEKPVFGVHVTLCDSWSSHRILNVHTGQPLAWLTHEASHSLYVAGTAVPLTDLFCTAQLILRPTRALTLYRCHHLAHTGRLFCFTRITDKRDSLCPCL